MLKIKSILPVFAVVLILGLSNAAFAQLSCSVASTPVSRATDTGLTEPAGDLIFNCVFGGTATTTATMTIDYGVPITDNTAYPAAGNTVSGVTGVVRIINVTAFAGGAPTIASVTNSTGQIVINIPAQNAAGNYSFTVTGVLLALSGSGKTSVSANVSVSPGNNVLITAGQTTAVVVTSVLPGIQSPTITTFQAPGLILTTGTVVATGALPILGGFSINVRENYIDSFRNASQFNGGQSTQGVQLLFTFTGIPAGVTFSGALGSSTTPCTATITSGAVTVPVTGAGTSVVTATNNTLLVEIAPTGAGQAANGPNLTAIDTVTLACIGVNIGATASLPLNPGTVTATVTMAPVGTAFSATGAVLTATTTGQIPRYTASQLPSPPLTVVNIIPATTNMLFPFVSVGGGFDTGFAIANTTGDPYGGTANGGARPQTGTVTMYFFPIGGTPFCVTTGGTATNPVTGGASATNCSVLSSTNVGLGLSTGGVVAPGSSWVVLGSEIFKSVTGAPATFNGYAFAVANFTNAHPSGFVADAAFSGKFTAGGPALTLNHPFIVARLGPGAAEILGH
jgi:hypothetical protein